MTFQSAATHLGDLLKEQITDSFWDGRACILEMKESGSNQWRQMEWIGFYFQFLCERVFSKAMQIPGPRYGNAEFDGFLEIPWDFKAHAMNTSKHDVIVNDHEAIELALADYGAVGLILALGEVEYNDESRKFQRWHSEQKGGKSKYEKEREARGAWSRKRKVSFALRQIMFAPLIEDVLIQSGSFQRGFRNADGNPRRAKVLINLEKLNEDQLHIVDF